MHDACMQNQMKIGWKNQFQVTNFHNGNSEGSVKNERKQKKKTYQLSYFLEIFDEEILGNPAESFQVISLPISIILHVIVQRSII